MSKRSSHNRRRALMALGFALFAWTGIVSGCAHDPQPNLIGTVVDARGHGVPGAVVRLAGMREEAVTEVDGRFLFAPLPPGTYLLSVSAEDQFARFSDSTRVREGRLTEVVLTLPELAVLSRSPTGEPITTIQIPSGTIQGTVADESGRALWGAYVFVMGGPGIRSGERTDEHGFFRIRGVPLGMHPVRVTATGFEQVDRDSVEVVIDGTTEVSFKLRSQPVESEKRPTGTILARIVTEKDEALAYAVLIVLGAQTAGQTDTHGRALIQNVPVGIYTVRVKLIGFAQVDRESVRVSEGDTTRVDFKLRPQSVRMGGAWPGGK